MEQLLADLHSAGVKLGLQGDELRITAPRGALTDPMKQALSSHKDALIALLRSRGALVEARPPALQADVAAHAEPFPLTDLQHAYWLGRDPALEMGGVATHLYLELDCPGLMVDRLNDALCRLIDRHGMLRAVVDGNGMQRILPTVPRYRIAITDCTTASAEVGCSAVDATRAVLSHQVLEPDRWPLFDVRATLLPQGHVRLHVSLDLLILDAMSMALLFREWRHWYDDPSWAPAALEISFRDYILAQRGSEDFPEFQRARAYWTSRVDTLPPAPELPMRADRAEHHPPRFSRREFRVPQVRWEALQAKAKRHGITPSCLLLAAYSAVLARWSATSHFTVNVVVSNRLQAHPDVNQLLGDFASTMLHEVDWREARQGFLANAQQLQARFIADLAHAQFSGVAALREWARRRNSTGQALMPVVFSGGLNGAGEEDMGNLEPFGHKTYCVSQTPQVWLDHYVREARGELICNWDAVDSAFKEGVLDAMFDGYRLLIEELADDDKAWTRAQTVPLPSAMRQHRVHGEGKGKGERDAHALPKRRLHAGFVEHAMARPEAPAVISGERCLTYGQLLTESVAVADLLIDQGIGPGQLVAVLMRKGWEQIVAVYGVLLAGGAYLPIDADLPLHRQMVLLHSGGVSHVLVQPGASPTAALADAGHAVHEIHRGRTGQPGPIHLASLDRGLDELAYVIFTSGTTGEPKGVMIDHRGAVNTMMHVNRMVCAEPKDRVLALSSLSFDLSVYDIFGLHDAGGAVVLPDHAKGHDPAHWRTLMETHGVTMWNSAPQLMRMFQDDLPPDTVSAIPLRKVLLSGDFIPLALPDRIRRSHPGVQVISLGGATEASIWSICHPVDAVHPGWASIPYGRALPNQTVWVGDRALQPCPDHVRGRIFIGGIGLAQGYRGDPQLTAARFITHPDSGERLYDTGDFGRHEADGSVMILGREDGQIKVRGHRVELGEIEAVLRKHPSVAQAVVRNVEDGGEGGQLTAHVEPVDGQWVNAQALREYLAERLPDHMVPRTLQGVTRMPLTANGKLDVSALPAHVPDENEATSRIAPRTLAERTVHAVWSRVLDQSAIGVTDNFFDVGGDSLLATRLVRELNAVLPFTLEMHELFENITVEALASLFERRTAAEAGTPVDVRACEELDHAAMQADIDTAQLQLKDLAQVVSTPAVPWRTVFLTGATGWLGSHVLEALLMRTTARLRCLVRADTPAEGQARLFDAMGRHGINIREGWHERIEPVCGDLTVPRLGLDHDAWRQLSEGTDAVCHLAASVNVLSPYSTHRDVNVLPLAQLVQLAAEHHAKPLICISPMTLCRRWLNGELTVLGRQAPCDDPRGLMTGYARSKWAAERILLNAAQQLGLPVKVYRTSHALPTARGGAAKSKDTYVSVLQAALAAGVVPDWDNSLFYGLPTDTLAGRLVADALEGDTSSGVVHIDNPDPPSLSSVVALLLDDVTSAPTVSAATWMTRCREVASQLEDADSGRLASMLFASTSSGVAVENMFSPHRLEVAHSQCGDQAALMPADYWRRVRQSLAQPAR